MSTDSVTGIYAQLDALLDTRIGTIARMDEDLAARVLSSGYHGRQADVFEGVDPIEYEKLYQARDSETLARSVITGCVELIYDLIKGLTEQSLTRPFHSGVKLVVNLHPYVLTDEEKTQLIHVLWTLLKGSCAIELTSLTEKEVTPRLCKASFAAMFVYGHDNWLDLHIEEWRTVQIPDIDMFAPALFRMAAPTQTELNKFIKKSGHPFKSIEELAKPFIRLQLLDSKIFSIVTS